MTEEPCDQAPPAEFDLDGMLGRLAKWLRILGFDAEYPVPRPRPGRIYLTARKSCSGPESIQIVSGDLPEQMRQVFEESGIAPSPDLFLCRCLACNEQVRPIRKEDVVGRAPARVLDLTDKFRECARCGRIYWEGTHPVRMKRRLKAWGLDLIRAEADRGTT
jgi:uncharacterized protein with PIN domain